MQWLDNPAELDFTAIVRPGDVVVCEQGLSEPHALTAALIEQRHEIGRFEMFLGPSYTRSFRPEHGDAIWFRSWCGTGGNSALHAAGKLDIVPSSYSDLPQQFADGVQRADVVLLSVGEPDGNGRFNLGLTCDYAIDAARRARAVVVEVSEHLPWVFGAELPSDIHPTHVLRSGRKPPQLDAANIDNASEQEQAIARNACSLVVDGATISLGVGKLPELVLRGLMDRRDLGVHSGVIGDGILDLIAAGVVTNHLKPIDTGSSVGGLLVGSPRLHAFAHRNPALLLRSSSYTHSNAILRKIPNFISLNGAIEIDLTGQVNAEMRNGRYSGAVGGQLDFIRGAAASAGGVSVIMLASTGDGGKASRIVPRLNDVVVTTPRSDVDAVATEWGVARLRGKSLRERANALIAIAHPDFREELARASF